MVSQTSKARYSFPKEKMKGDIWSYDDRTGKTFRVAY